MSTAYRRFRRRESGREQVRSFVGPLRGNERESAAGPVAEQPGRAHFVARGPGARSPPLAAERSGRRAAKAIDEYLKQK